MTYSQINPTKVRGFSQVKRYILEQQGKDVFEYSVFGSPQQKIGDFTKQAKLTGWSG